MVIGGVLIALVGAGLIYLGMLSRRGELTRNSFAGVRTSATMRSDRAFRVGNQVAAPFLTACGIVWVITGIIASLLPRPAGVPVLLIGVLFGAAAAIAGGIKGHRAAAAVGD